MTFTAFGRQFSDRVADWQDELLTLEREGATYEHWILDDDEGGPGFFRVRLRPAEIYRFVAAVAGWDEYLAGGFDAVSDRQLAREAVVMSDWRANTDPDIGVCPADFLGAHLENLLCGGKIERAERLHPKISASDAHVLLHEIASGLPTALKALTKRGSTRTSFMAADERDIQDVVFLILRSVFHDTRREEPTPGHAGGTKRIDMVIPSSRTAVEIKFVRDPRHATSVASELKIDIESYHTHPDSGTLFVLVWDPHRHLKDPQQLERDLTGPRTKGDVRFHVAVRVV